MDVSSSSFVDFVKECSTELDVEKEPSISTFLMNFESLIPTVQGVHGYILAAFATRNRPYDYTSSGNPTRDVLRRLLAEQQ